jgi:hypothetical protein
MLNARHSKLFRWCDEATFVNWQQSEDVLPDWDDAYERLIVSGEVVHLKFESPANAARSFPAIAQPA